MEFGVSVGVSETTLPILRYWIDLVVSVVMYRQSSPYLDWPRGLPQLVLGVDLVVSRPCRSACFGRRLECLPPAAVALVLLLCFV